VEGGGGVWERGCKCCVRVSTPLLPPSALSELRLRAGWKAWFALGSGWKTHKEMMAASECKFQERCGEDPLVQFLIVPGRLPHDTPLLFGEVLSHCPPGTEMMDLVRTLSKRQDLFRQSSDATHLCVRPRSVCKGWRAVNPYLDPTKPAVKVKCP